MFLRKLKPISESIKSITAFGGFNHTDEIGDGEFYFEENMSSGLFPILSPRKSRESYDYGEHTASRSYAISGRDELCRIEGSKIYIGNSEVSGITLNVDIPDRYLVSFGAYLIVFPDGIYVNTSDITDKGNINNIYNYVPTSGQTATTVSLCKSDGSTFSPLTVSASAPTNPSNGDYWLDTSGYSAIMRAYSQADESWSVISSTYVKISSPGIAAGFSEEDSVKIIGLSSISSLASLDGKYSVIRKIYNTSAGGGAEDYIVIGGTVSESKTLAGGIYVERRMPADIKYVFESGNRLWGCRHSGSVNEICASALGDFKNWYSFRGISTDSYAASCGSDGDWTGGVKLGNYPMFFKANRLHKVYGNIPSEFRITESTLDGIGKRCFLSAAVCGTSLFYKSENGICIFDGATVKDISSPLGEYARSGAGTTFENIAVGGVIDDKYYISFKSAFDGNYHLFVYDFKRGIWHREDNLICDGFANYDGKLWYIDRASGLIKNVGTCFDSSDDVKWFCESGEFCSDDYGGKYVSEILVKMSLDVGANASVYIRYDGEKEYNHISTVNGKNLRTFILPLKTKRCERFSLKLKGSGGVKIYSIGIRYAKIGY